MFIKMYAYKNIKFDDIIISIAIKKTDKILSKLKDLETTFDPASTFMKVEFKSRSNIMRRINTKDAYIKFNMRIDDVVYYQKILDFFKNNIRRVKFQAYNYIVDEMRNADIVEFIKNYNENIITPNFYYPVLDENSEPKNINNKKIKGKYFINDVYFLITNKFFGFMGVSNQNEQFILSNKTLVAHKFRESIFDGVKNIEVFMSSLKAEEKFYKRNRIYSPFIYFYKADKIYTNDYKRAYTRLKCNLISVFKANPMLPRFSKDISLVNLGEGNLSFSYTLVRS